MSEDDIRELALLMAVPEARDLPDYRDRAIRNHLMAEIRAAAGPRRATRRNTIGLITAVSCAAAAAVVFALLPASSPGARQAATTPAVLLGKIAAAAARQPSPRVSDSEFEYIRSEVAFSSSSNGGPLIMGTLHERQIWLSVSDICRTGLLIEYGQRTPITALPVIGNKIVSEAYARKHMGFTGCGKGPIGGDPTYRLLQSLPTDPRTLLGVIYRATKGQGSGPDSEAFVTIGDLIKEAIVPPRTAAALYRAAALIPGITIIHGVKNAVGQPGLAISRVDGTYRDVWIFNPATLQYIGERQYLQSTGALIGETAVLHSAFVARPGQLP